MSATPADRARQIVRASDLVEKVALAKETAQLWHRRTLTLVRRSSPERMPDRPGRPPELQLLPPREMPRRSLGGDKSRIAHLHALTHIELSAVDMTWDLIGRFCAAPVPQVFFDDWVRVGVEEAKHFELLADRLVGLGSFYGALPAHDGLWHAAQATGESLLARVAVVPMVLEARGLDVGPAMIEKATAIGDTATARILEIIYRDEKRHVAFGAKWFRYFCEQRGLQPEPTFHALVRQNFRGPLKPPFNDKARSEAGLTPGFYKPLSALGISR